MSQSIDLFLQKHSNFTKSLNELGDALLKLIDESISMQHV